MGWEAEEKLTPDRFSYFKRAKNRERGKLDTSARDAARDGELKDLAWRRKPLQVSEKMIESLGVAGVLEALQLKYSRAHSVLAFNTIFAFSCMLCHFCRADIT